MSRWAPLGSTSLLGAPACAYSGPNMAAGRNPPLDELGLPENARLEVVLCADKSLQPEQQRKLLGKLVDGLIELVAGHIVGQGFALGQRVDPRDFLTAAGYSRRVTNHYKYIWLDEPRITLASRVDGDEANAKAEGQRIARLLADEYGVKSLEQLWQHVEVRCPVARNAVRHVPPARTSSRKGIA